MTQPKVVIYTQPDCPPCHVAKVFLVEKVIGEEVMIGFDPERLDEILGK